MGDIDRDETKGGGEVRVEGEAVALIFHFDTMESAQLARARLAQMGGLCECEGHIWDEEENTGYVSADAWDGTLFTKEGAHIQLGGAIQDAEQALDQDPRCTPEVFALLPLYMMSGSECEDSESNRTVRMLANKLLASAGGEE